MKINYEKLTEVLEPYGLYIYNNKIVNTVDDITFISLTSKNIEKFVEDVKNNNLSTQWAPTIKLLISILHPHYNAIFEKEINKEKLIEVFKKYGGWKVENNKIVIPYNHCSHLVKTYKLDDLINAYTNKDEVTSEGNIILSFMHHYENEFME